MSKIIIVAPPYSPFSHGICVMHALYVTLLRLGFESYMVFYSEDSDGNYSLHKAVDRRFYSPEAPTFIPPIKDKYNIYEFAEDAIVIYPEIITNNLLHSRYVIRYFLNRSGAINGRTVLMDTTDYIVAFDALYHENPHDILCLPPVVSWLEDCDYANQKYYDVIYYGKGPKYTTCTNSFRAIEISRTWPTSKTQLRSLLRYSRFFYTWDIVSATTLDAIASNVIPIHLTELPYERRDLERSIVPPFHIWAGITHLEILKKANCFDLFLKYKNFCRNTIDGNISGFDASVSAVLGRAIRHFSNR